MFKGIFKSSLRGRRIREQRQRGAVRHGPTWFSGLITWKSVVATIFTVAVCAINLLGEDFIDHVIGERVEHAIHAKVSFRVLDEAQTAADREAARAKVPSYYTLADKALTVDRIRAGLMRLYELAAEESTFEGFAAGMQAQGMPAEKEAYAQLRLLVEMPDGEGRVKFQQWLDHLPLDKQYVVRGLSREDRTPASATDFVAVESKGTDGEFATVHIPQSELVQQGNKNSLHGSATKVARHLPPYDLRPTAEAAIVKVFSEQPTILFNKERTAESMQKAGAATPEAWVNYEKSQPLVAPGVLSAKDYAVLEAHQAAYLRFLNEKSGDALALRQERILQQAGLAAVLGLLCMGLMLFVRVFHPELLDNPTRTILFFALVTATMAATLALRVYAPHVPETILGPCLLAASIMAIAYPRRFALGAACIVVFFVCVSARSTLMGAIAFLVGVSTCVYQLDEIRSRTKLLKAGLITAGIISCAMAAGGLLERQPWHYVIQHAVAGGASAVFTAFILSGVLPFIERTFRIATSQTLLEWRDPTRPLLQLLAREAPGTYNHSLVLGNLVENACAAIGANGLLAQVGALYHDIGKIHRPAYFTENQEGRISRHENLAPTMSLLIILGHVKDGLELARQYKLPRVLQQFIAEHHGTTVVRYFHRRASDKQPQIALGKHDREVSEADFRYGGPKPHTRESAVLMICDGVEGAVRSLPEPTVGRIESTVHEIISDRLNDGQFDDCEITLREIRLVEESVVKTLCGIYHGRVAYPKPRKADEPAMPPMKVGVGV